jgi:hypothetical protein
MQKLKVISVLAIATALSGCGRSGEGKLELNEVADSTSSAVISSSAAVENNKDTSRKFIRTADLKFKVKSVIKSTYDIENITSRQGGFVTYTNISSSIDHVTNIPVSADSSLETTYYTVTNSITLRVPNTKLDTTLKEIALNIDYLDYRIIKADDVALQMLSNKLVQNRSAKNEARLTNAIDNRGEKLNETTLAEDILLSKQEESDQAKISNLSLSDQIKFSTVSLFIYQRQTIKRELISNDKNIESYEPGFGTKIVESMEAGWDSLEVFIVFLAKLWGLLVFAVLGYFIYKRYGQKRKKA